VQWAVVAETGSRMSPCAAKKLNPGPEPLLLLR
jgi:hypothetical protein